MQFLLGIHADFQLHFSLFANEKLRQRVNAGVYRNLLCLCLSGCYQQHPAQTPAFKNFLLVFSIFIFFNFV